MKRPTLTRISLAPLIVVIELMAAISPAAAQTTARGTDVSAGYLNVNGFMHGWNVQISSPVTRRWSVVGEVNWSKGRDCRDCDPVYRDLAVLAGVRFGWQPAPRISPFWQILAGGLHSRSEGYYYDIVVRDGVAQRYQEAYTMNYLALQPGGGVTVMFNSRVGVRAQADVQFAVTSEGSSVFPRVVVGGVVRLGR